MAAQVLTLQVDAETAAALARSAGKLSISVEQFALEAIAVRALEHDVPLREWSADDLAAIREGIAQLDRGESYTQEEVEAHIDALLRE